MASTAPTAPPRLGAVRDRLLADAGLRGRAFTEAWTAQVDAVLISRFERELAERGGIAAIGPVALVAVGGYGRGDLSPYSDLDLIVLAPEGSAARRPGRRHLVPDLGRRPEAGPRTPHAAGGDRSRRRRPRHRHLPADRPAPRRRRRDHRRRHRRGAGRMAVRRPPVPDVAARRGRRTTAARRGGRLPPRARPQGGPRRSARPALAGVGAACPTGAPARRRGAVDRGGGSVHSPSGSSCTA